MGTLGHGRHGLIYVSGHEIAEANAWEINVTQAAAEGRYFGFDWTQRADGVKDWTGSITAYADQDSDYLYEAVTANATVAILIYPKRSDLSTYWSGSALFTGFRSSGGMDDYVGETADFSGAGSLTDTGFA